MCFKVYTLLYVQDKRFLDFADLKEGGNSEELRFNPLITQLEKCNFV